MREKTRNEKNPPLGGFLKARKYTVKKEGVV